MVRITEIQDNLLHLIGWRQSYDSNDGIHLSESLTQSDSGLYYQDVHPLLTLQNLSSLAPDFQNYDFPEHDSEKPYKKDEVVKATVNDISKLFKAKQNVPADILITNTEYWAETNPFSEWLETKTKASITKAVNRFINEKIAKGTFKALCEKKTLFDGTGRICDIVKNKQNLVGFEIVPIRSKGVTTKINRIGLQFTESGEYTVILMHSSQIEPYYQETFVKKTNNSMEWFTPSEDLYLPYESDKVDAGGSWYLCYLQSKLPENSNAIYKNRDWSKGPCNECSRHEYDSWKIWSRFLEVHPFSVNEELLTFDDETLQMWDVENNIYDYTTNYGINLDITIACDITDFIIDQKLLMDDYICKSLAVDFLREFAYNPNVRTNRHSINASRQDILYELDGDSSSMKKSGLSYQLENALKALEISTMGIDRVCQPCVNHGVRYVSAV